MWNFVVGRFGSKEIDTARYVKLREIEEEQETPQQVHKCSDTMLEMDRMNARIVECESNIRVLFGAVTKRSGYESVVHCVKDAITNIDAKVEEYNQEISQLTQRLERDKDVYISHVNTLRAMDEILKLERVPETILSLTTETKKDVMSSMSAMSIEDVEKRIREINEDVDQLKVKKIVLCSLLHV